MPRQPDRRIRAPQHLLVKTPTCTCGASCSLMHFAGQLRPPQLGASSAHATTTAADTRNAVEWAGRAGCKTGCHGWLFGRPATRS
ncbi:hypothetical protein MRX96_026018 [Rhipicephalus microplus]